ncbi:MAG: hypothetical protein WC717_04200 [Candidatus Micrarchaeia archaeon]
MVDKKWLGIALLAGGLLVAESALVSCSSPQHAYTGKGYTQKGSKNNFKHSKLKSTSNCFRQPTCKPQRR